MSTRVVVGMSGGVDSSVAAYLLKKKGYEVIGIFMKNWHNNEVTRSRECPWEEDSTDALIVGHHLGIPFQTIDLSKEYKKHIVDYMFSEYQQGRTPNPDILCNSQIKFDLFLEKALSLGAEYIATGHYCIKKSLILDQGKKIYQLLSGRDNTKDQSYFLCQLNQYQISKSLFPLGELSKHEVREVAKKVGLITAEKKDSQGLCFIGKVRLSEFLGQQLKPKKGKIIEVSPNNPVFNHRKNDDDFIASSLPYILCPEDGKEIGEHNGAHYYTIGQRKGLGIGGYSEPLFTIDTDTKKNIIYVGRGATHPGLFRKGIFVSCDDEHWIREDLKLQPGESQRFIARIRYQQPLEGCLIIKKKEGLYILFDKPQWGVAPGQFVVWYTENEMIGSGTIFHHIPIKQNVSTLGN